MNGEYKGDRIVVGTIFSSSLRTQLWCARVDFQICPSFISILYFHVEGIPTYSIYVNAHWRWSLSQKPRDKSCYQSWMGVVIWSWT